MTTSHRERLLALTTGILIIVVVLFEFIFEPQLEKRKQLMTQYIDLKLKATVIQNDLLVRDHVEQQYKLIRAQLQCDLNSNQSQRTDDQELGSFAQSLLNLQEKHGLAQKSFRLSGTEQQASFKILKLQLELQGHVSRLLHFIRAVEYSSEPWEIHRCDIRACDQKDIVKAIFEIRKIVAGT